MAAVGVAPPGVVAGGPAEDLSATGLLVCEGRGAGERLAFRVALNDSARALSALVPTPPRDRVTPSCSQSVACPLEVYWAPWSAWTMAPRSDPRPWVSGRLSGLCGLVIGAVVEPEPNVFLAVSRSSRFLQRDCWIEACPRS
jgi:hypothetical protein